ncbi:pentapeptide repeat-containing protein [Candidatus Parabeggiatoa sp. HSG14]|uniref:pentapeptide repeat-containing protein n=1 Tax=Candidatus Parabeggiatoa sp. HSG14 TaxID=3055593 RepID=UPI0025A8258D|nr:pentapeptide repeat-containing protein [Thiotrichales bacterium HSG14]
MKTYTRYLCIILSLILPTLTIAKECEGPYKGQTVTPEQLKKIFAQHLLWLRETKQNEKYGGRPDYQDKRRANLCGAQLQGINLAKADLSLANLKHANLSKARLLRVNLHRAWLDDAILHKAELFKADMSQAFLSRANLSHADLYKANLTEADLKKSNFNDTNLHGANFHKARLIDAKFVRANLRDADFSNTNLTEVNLSYAKLAYTNLTKSILTNADLSHSYLFQTILTESYWLLANLNESTFYPKYNALPDIVTFVPTLKDHFNNVDFYDDRFGAPPLMALRAAYKKVGMRNMERLITKLVKQEEQHAHWRIGGLANRIDSIFSLVLFDWPSAYGFAPLRPLKILLVATFVFGVIYWLGLRTGFMGAQVCVRWESKIVTSNERRGIRKGFHGPDIYHAIKLHHPKNLRSEMRLLRVAFNLSLLSAFHIGWKQFDVGMWIKELQRREYSLEVSKGWIRRLCGLQSLISVYMVALWAMTQFGRPFE